MDQMSRFCKHIRAALALYVSLPPEAQAMARMYATRKGRELRAVCSAAESPGGDQAAELLHRIQSEST